MRVVPEYPPNYDEIAAAFPGIRGRKPIFAWGDVIYNPHRIDVSPALLAHEQVHGTRQLAYRDALLTDAMIAAREGRADFKYSRIETWWRHYIADPRFRLMEELLAHAAEYGATVESPHCNRHTRRAALKAIAQRLASPLYGSLISARDAMIAIAEPEKPFRTRLPDQGAAAI